MSVAMGCIFFLYIALVFFYVFSLNVYVLKLNDGDRVHGMPVVVSMKKTSLPLLSILFFLIVLSADIYCK